MAFLKLECFLIIGNGAEDISKPLAKEGEIGSAPRGIRTHDPRFRSASLEMPPDDSR